MVTSILLIAAQRSSINTIAETMASIDGVSEVYSVSGSYDLVAVLRVENNDQLAYLVTDRLLDIEGIEHTETMLAFRAYSRHDLESMFSI
jgi:DNA-binding Lrp family transcriptional regulator